MLDFVEIKYKRSQNGLIIYPDFNTKKCTDIMIRGGKFYAIWDQEKKIWSTDEHDVQELVDKELWNYVKAKNFIESYDLQTMESFSSGSWLRYRKFVSNSPDIFVPLDPKVIFANDKIKKTDYSSKHLDYVLEEGPCEAYEKLVSTLYEPEERDKIEWAIGSIVAGDSIDIQKFLVFYGDPGSGKGTILKIIKKLFDPYCTTFTSKDLGSSKNQFATEPFKNNPLVAIENDGDLSKIDDNTRLNTIIAHEELPLNSKYEKIYTGKVKAMLFIGSNSPVKITDGKSGILRRLIDVNPSGTTLPAKEYENLLARTDFEKGAIAYHCLQVYKDLGKNYYMGYRPISMIYKTNAFYNFVEYYYDMFAESDGVSLVDAWNLYKAYAEETKMEYQMPMYRFREELKNYFSNFKERARINGKQVRNYYWGFRKNKFLYEYSEGDFKNTDPDSSWLNFEEQDSLFDKMFKDYPAQYDAGGERSKPATYWDACDTILEDINTKKLHWVKTPLKLICIDFDLKDEKGQKSFLLNLEAASKFPPTYAELSKSGGGIHLYYIYDGDVTNLSAVYSNDIEVKVYTGNSSLRRKLTKCNDIPIATITSGLPLKGEKKVINREAFKSEQAIRALIEKNLNKEIHANTAPSVDFIYSILEQAYAQNGLSYDVSDMRQAIMIFAMGSTHQSKKCVNLVHKMHFMSSDIEERLKAGTKLIEEPKTNYKSEDPLTFFDVEVFPNLFVVVFKTQGKIPTLLINPDTMDISKLLSMKLVGYNCRRYDNHILYGRMIGYDNYNLYLLSQNIIAGDKNSFFSQAYNISYTDVYDFCSKKQSLKKWEIELGLHHQECPYRWDEPVPEDKWDEVANYCINDVEATEAVFEENKGDFIAREILADLADMTVNDTTNSLTTRIIFGKEKHPKLIYTDLKTGERFDGDNRSLGIQDVPFPEYEWKRLDDNRFHNMYRGVDLGKGGYVYAEPGMYYNIALLDVASLHPHSIKAMNMFGEATKNFTNLMDTRLFIKHKDYDSAKKLFGGKLVKYLDDPTKAKQLSKALKIAINSVYGLTSATFENPFKDPRNVNNIVALRGALFMKTLQDEVVKRGYKVIHVKTDSIKIPIAGADKDIINFCMDFARKYGYEFEHEATYERMCLVNDAVYIAKYADKERCMKLHGYFPSANEEHFEETKQPWTATGAQFQHPYVFKYLFSKEPIEFKDMCEAKSVTTAIYLDLNESMPMMIDSKEEKEYSSLSKLILYKKGQKAFTKEIERLLRKYENFTDGELEDRFNELKAKNDSSHKYIFIGKTGLFCPVVKGAGGGWLVRQSEDGYSSVTGAKDQRWLESERVLETKRESSIDISYFRKLVDAAIENINQYGDFYEFTSDSIDIPKLSEPIVFDITSDELPF